jgi:hypothetical protein
VLCRTRPTAVGVEAEPLKGGGDDASAMLVLQLAAMTRATTEMTFILAWADGR